MGASSVNVGVAKIPVGPVVLPRDGENEGTPGGVGVSTFAGVSPVGCVPGMSAIPSYALSAVGRISGLSSLGGKAGSTSVGVPAVGEKRGPENVATLSPAQTVKKRKYEKKARRQPPSKKKVGAASSPLSGFPKKVKPPLARPALLKYRSGNKPAPGANSPPSSPGGLVGSSTLSPDAPPEKRAPAGVPSAPGSAAGSGAGKRNGSEDGVWNVVNGVVDIEAEEDRLAMRVELNEVIKVDATGSDESMFLSAGKLRAKMQAVAKKFLPDEKIGNDVMEMMSFAVEERLRQFLEKLTEAVAFRTENAKKDWIVEDDGPDVFEKLKQMQEDEERELKSAAEMRVKKRNERKDAEAKKASFETTTGEKKKESSGSGIAERNEGLALQKKRLENRSQHDASSGLVEERDKRGKLPLSYKMSGLAPIGSSSGQPAIGGAGALPSIGSKPNSQSCGTNAGSKNNILDGIEKLSKLGPLRELGRHAILEEKSRPRWLRWRKNP